MDLREIKKADLREYVRAKYGLECNSSGKILCPFHDEKTPSLHFYQTKGGSWGFKCHGASCGKGGSIVDFVMAMEGIEKKEAIARVLKDFEGPIKKADPKNLAPAVKKAAPDPGAKKRTDAHDLGKAKLKIHFDYKDPAGKVVYRKIKYFFEDGEKEYTFKHPAPGKPGEWDWTKGKGEFIPYNLDRFKGKTEVVVCEGEKDTITIDRLKGDLLATTAPTGEGNWDDALTPHFKDFKKTYFLYDVGNEKDAEKWAGKLQTAFPKMEIFIVKVPLEEKDADITDYLSTFKDLEQKRKALAALLGKAGKFTIDLKELEESQRKERLFLTLDVETKTQAAAGGGKKLWKIKRIIQDIEAVGGAELTSTKMADIKEESIDWLWEGRIPIGFITLIAGHPGVGKSFFTNWLVAKLSRGEALPDENRWDRDERSKVHSSLLITSEDIPGSMIKPRLRGNLADMDKIEYLDSPLCFNFDDLTIFERFLDKRPNFNVVCIDALISFLGGKVNYFMDLEVRQKLDPLLKIADERRLAILGVVHFNKREDAELITRIGGSMAFQACARSTLGVAWDTRDLEDPQSLDTRLLFPIKTNLCRRPDVLAYTVNDDLSISFEKDALKINPDGIFSREAREKKQRRLYAEQWLLDYLQKGEKTLSEIEKAAVEDKVPPATLYRARNKLIEMGLVDSVTRGFGKEKESLWMLKGKSLDFKD